MATQAEEARSSSSGVNLDEEAARLIQFQHYFAPNQLTMGLPLPGLSLHDYFGAWQLREPTTGETLDVAGWGHPWGCCNSVCPPCAHRRHKA